jgi:fluoroacetyl-CoA thioesterase
MKLTLDKGISISRQIIVDETRSIKFLGEGVRIYTTPELVRDFERTCNELLLAYCDPGENSVGTGISVTHSGSALMGSLVEITVTVTGVDGRKVTFEVLARDRDGELSRGEHSRFVISVDKLKERLAAKAARLAAG